MTLSEIIENNDSNMEDIEGYKNISNETKGKIEMLYDEINGILGEAIDEYGDECDSDDDED